MKQVNNSDKKMLQFKYDDPEERIQHMYEILHKGHLITDIYGATKLWAIFIKED